MHEYPVERIFRDAKLGSIGGGTSEIMRLIISRSIFAAGKPI
jgi:alkylation response protein AidB-like acyl-CoA dehydrogenase